MRPTNSQDSKKGVGVAKPSAAQPAQKPQPQSQPKKPFGK